MIPKRTIAALAVVLACCVGAPAAHAAEPMIVGGTSAPAGAWPSIALLEGRYDDGGQETIYHCTGSVVAPTWIVTAAHCAFGAPGQPPDAMKAVLGKPDYQDPDADVVAVDRFVPNPEYDRTTEANDLALLHLSRAVSEPPIRLATAAEANAGAYVSPANKPNAAGWGATDEDGTRFPTLLQEAYLQIQSNSSCRGMEDGFDTSTQTCAGTPGSAGVCFGDSGGPLVMFDASSGQQVLWGVTSYRPSVDDQAPCSLSQIAVFSWIPGFSDFIQSTLASSEAVGSPPNTDVSDQAPAPPPKTTLACRKAKKHLTAAKRSEKRLRRNLVAARKLPTSSEVRARVKRATRRYHTARDRRERAATRVRRVCRGAG